MSSVLKRLAKAVPSVTRELAGAKPVDMMGDYRKTYKFKTKFGLLGPVSAGKTTLCAAIVETSEDQSATDPTFYARVLPSSSTILRDANKLRLGRFPEKTDPTAPTAPEAGLLISRRGMINNKGVHVPICDVAGEVSDYLCETGGSTPAEKIRCRESGIAHQVIDTVRECQGFIIALDANDSILFREGLEEEDNDAYMHDVLTNIFEWRRRQHKPDPHIILVLTKWDEVITKAKMLNMDAYDGEGGLQRFLDNGFPAMSMLLKPLRDKGMVRFFRSWFNLERDPDGNVMRWEDGKPKIHIIENERAYMRFKPDFSQPDIKDLIDYIGTFG